MSDAHKNFAYSTVATAPSPASSGTSLTVQSGDGALFPAVPFNATVWPTGALPLSSNAEIVRVTNRSTDTLTITRAQESSSARSIVIGDQIAATITAKTLTDVEDRLNTVATSGSAQTVNWATAPTWDITLSANCTFTLSSVTSGTPTTLTLILRQDATGSRTVTWPGSVTWLSGSAPTLHTGASTLDVVQLVTVDGGTNWYGAQASPGTKGYLGSATITSGFTTSSSTVVQVTGLTTTVTIPTGGHTKVTVWVDSIYNTTANNYVTLALWDGTVGSGTQLATAQSRSSSLASGDNAPASIVWVGQPAAGSKTYNVGLFQTGGGTAGIIAGATDPALILVEQI